MSNDLLDLDDKKEFVDEQAVNVLVAKYAARKVSEVKIEWPLHDGHTFTIRASRRISNEEFRTLEKLIRLAKAAFVETPIVASEAAQAAKGK